MILIVGGAGYIGSHTNKFLHSKGYETVVFDNLVYGHKDFVKWGHFVLGDLSDKQQISLCFERYPITEVMHFGAYTYVGESVVDPSKYYYNNVVSVLNLLEVMKDYEVKSFIFSSTCATYGVPQEIPITENHSQRPINPYGKTKLMVEEILKDYDEAYGIKHVNLRYFNAAGADDDGELGERHDPETHLIPLACFAAFGRRENIEIFGTDYQTKDGTCIRDYIHVMDLAQAHTKALEYLKRENKSNSFNLGNGKGYSVKEVLDCVQKLSGHQFEIIESKPRIGDPAILIGSSEKSQKELGWKPQYGNLEAIIQTALNWHVKDCSIDNYIPIKRNVTHL